MRPMAVTDARLNLADYRGYMLLLLMTLQAFNYVERHALALLMEQIKHDLVLSDTQLGFLTGIAFALFYSVLGIPLAKLADRNDRVHIIAFSAAVAGVAIAGCAAATSFAALLLIRVFVAIGEAGCVPPAHSLIGEHFDRHERTRAFGIFHLGVPLSTLISTAAAGWLNERLGWRPTFVILGLPGLLLAALALFTLREPRRRLEAAASPRLGNSVPGLVAVLRTLWAKPTFRYILLGYSIGAFFSFGISQWNATFFIRQHGFDTGELGVALALIWGLGGLAGTYFGGVLASRYASGNEGLQLRWVAAGFFMFGLLSAGVYAAPGAHLALFFMTLSVVGVFMVNAPLFATIQALVPDHMRATAIAILFLFSNLVGLGLGPLAVGALSDWLAAGLGPQSLRYALLILSPGWTLTALLLWRSARTATADIEATTGGMASLPADAAPVA